MDIITSETRFAPLHGDRQGLAKNRGAYKCSKSQCELVPFWIEVSK